MSKIELRQLQMLELEIVKEIKRICDEEEIEYFMIGGSLLGAVRHKGFIPWDDDFDIGMKIGDYEKFLEVAPGKLSERFMLQSSKDDETYGCLFSKVRLKNTHMRERLIKNVNTSDGIFVDVFPYDPVDVRDGRGSLHLKKLRVLGKLKMLKSGYDLNAISEKKLTRFLNVILNSIPITRARICELIEIEIANHFSKMPDLYVERDGMFKGNFVFDKHYFDEIIELQFENLYLKAPKRYDDYLKHAYGNYMEYPSEAERNKGHFVDGIELEFPYANYFEE